MDDTTKVVNFIYVIFGTALGIGTGVYVYRLTMHYVREIQLDTDLEEVLGPVDPDELEDDEDDHVGGDDDVERRLLRMDRVKNASRSREMIGGGHTGAHGEYSEGADGWEGTFSDFDEEERIGASDAVAIDGGSLLGRIEDDAVATDRGYRVE